MWKYVAAFALVVLCFCRHPVFAAQAQGNIVIDASEATVAFPDTVNFHLEAQADAEIERVTLVYGTDGRSCQSGGSRQRLDFDAAESVTLDWEWELKRSGSLPPGVRIWWQWEVETSAGDLFVSEAQETIVVDDRHEWRTLSEGGVSVNWYRGGTSFGQALLDEATTALDRLSVSMGISRPTTITLWIYPAAADVREAVLNTPEWTGGIAFPDYNSTIIGVAPGQDEWAARVIPHELLHLVLGIRMFNCRGIHLPTWLEEGLARYAENNVTTAESAQVDEALQDGRLPPLSSLARGFSAYGSSASLSYTQSYRVVSFLYEEYGPGKMSELLTTMQGGMRIDPALQQVFGFDTNGLDVAWRAAAGYQATPTAFADALAAQATPTLVPTLALIAPPAAATATPTPSATPTDLPTATAVATQTPTLTPTTSPTPQAVAVAATEIVDGDKEAAPAAAEPIPQNTPNWLLFAGAGVVILLLLALIIVVIRR